MPGSADFGSVLRGFRQTTIARGVDDQRDLSLRVDAANPSTVIQATTFTVLNPNLVDALSCFVGERRENGS